jgi:hypothetical protein
MFHSSKLVAVLGTLLLLAAAASAQNQPTTYIYDAYLDNQATVNTCSAGENANLNGTIRFTYYITPDSSGVNHFVIKAASNLTGVGQTTGANYTAAESNEYDANTPDSSKEMTVELSSDLNSQGGTASMTLVQSLHITVDANGDITAEVVTNNTSCGGSN